MQCLSPVAAPAVSLGSYAAGRGVFAAEAGGLIVEPGLPVWHAVPAAGQPAVQTGVHSVLAAGQPAVPAV